MISSPRQSLATLSFFQRLRRHPKGLWFVFWGELAERASYYGMKTLLALYLVNRFSFSEQRSGSNVEYFTAACYVLPIVGGIIADRLLGKYRTIVYWSFPYIMGHIVLGDAHSELSLYVALALLAMGSGAIKPNTSTLMGLVYEREGKMELLPEAFSFFYAAINIGAAATSISLPIVKNAAFAAGYDGYRVALMCPTILMALALLIFVTGKKHYPQEYIDRTPKPPEQKREEVRTLVRLSGVFLLIALFWFVYDQTGSTWVLFGTAMMDFRLYPFNISVSAEQMQGLNPVLIIVLTPFFNWFWGQLATLRGGRPVPATQKMMLGFLLVVLCMGTMAVAGYQTHDGTVKVTIWYEVLATLVITMAELCVSVVGLEFAFNNASPKTRSTVTAAFLFTVFIGDMFGGWFVDRFYKSLGYGQYFAVQAFIMLCVACAFYFVAKRFERNEEQRGAAYDLGGLPSIEAVRITD